MTRNVPAGKCPSERRLFHGIPPCGLDYGHQPPHVENGTGNTWLGAFGQLTDGPGNPNAAAVANAGGPAGSGEGDPTSGTGTGHLDGRNG